VIDNKFSEGSDRLNAAIRSGMTSVQVIVASAASVGWGSNKAVILLYLVTWPSTLRCRVKKQDSKHYDSHL